MYGSGYPAPSGMAGSSLRRNDSQVAVTIFSKVRVFSGRQRQRVPMGYRVIIVEDNPIDKDLAVREIARHLPEAICEHIADIATFRSRLVSGRIDAVVTDYRLQSGNGLDVLRAVRERYPETVVIMFTGSGNEDVAVEGMKLGLDDYVIKKQGNYPRVAFALRSALDRVATRMRLGATEQELRRTIRQLEQRTLDLAEKNSQLEEFMKNMTGRELRMAELVNENHALRAEIERLKNRGVR